MRKKQQDRNCGHGRTVMTVIAALLLAAGPTLAGGRCVTVDVPAPFVTPDGDRHPPGSLRLCDSQSLSPVAGLHKVYVDGHLIHMALSRKGRSEGPAQAAPFVQFRKNGREPLELIGYAWPDGKHMKTYVMVRNDAKGTGTRRRQPVAQAALPPEALPKEEQVILVATRGD